MWSVLRRRDFALLWTGGLISLTGDWVLFVGLPLYVYDRTGSTLATGGVFLARLLPEVLFGSVAGVFVDRWDRRRTLVVSNVLLAGTLVPLLIGAVSGQLWLIYAASPLATTLGQFVKPAEHALLPRLVDEGQLVPANALNSLNNNLARLVGPPVGGILYTLTGFAGVAVVDAASFLAAALLIASVRADARPLREPDELHIPDRAATSRSRWLTVWQEWLAGLHLMRQTRPAAVVLLFAALTGLGEGVVMTLFVPFVRTVLDAGDASYGILLAAQAVGGLVGGVVVARAGRWLSPSRLWGYGALGLALIDLVIFTYPLALSSVLPAIALMVVVGVPVAGLIVGLLTVGQTAVADAYRGRLMGAYVTTTALTMAMGTIVAGVLGEFVGIVPLLLTQVVAYFMGGVLVLILLRPGESSAAAIPSVEPEIPTITASS